MAVVNKTDITPDKAGGMSADSYTSAAPYGPQALRWRFGKAAVWNTIGAVFTQGATFLSNILIANLLGREVFGQYSIILSTLLTVVGIAQVATGLTATRYVAELRSKDKERAGRILGMCSTVALVTGVGATVILGMSAGWLASDVLKVPEAAHGMLIAAVVVLFSVMNAYQTGALAGLESYPTLAKLGVLTGIVQVAASVGFCWLWGLDGAVLGLVITAALRWWLHARAIKDEAATFGIHVTRRGLRQEKSLLLRFILPGALSGVTTLPAIWLANAFLVRQPNGVAEMALFAAANYLRILVLFVPNLVNGVGISLINSQLATKDQHNYSKVFWANLFLTSAAAISGAVLVAALGPILLGLFGQEFVLGTHVLFVLLAATVLEGIALGPYQIVQSQGKMWLSLLLVALPRDISLAFSAYFLTAQHSAVGLAYAYTAAWGLALVLITVLAYRISGHGKLTSGYGEKART